MGGILVDPALQRSPLYGNLCGCNNPSEDQHIHITGAGAQQGSGARINRCARREHVVNENERHTVDGSLAALGHRECALHVHDPRTARQTTAAMWRARA